MRVGCSYCGSKPGERCKVTLSETPDQKLSVVFYHSARVKTAES